jgi:hypothetical protein
MFKYFMNIKFPLAGAVLTLCSLASSAQSTTKLNTVTTAMPFLRIVSDARAGGMGDVGIASPADVNGAQLNPAKMAYTDRDFGVGLTYTPWLRQLVNDIYIVNLNGFATIKDKKGSPNGQTIGGSLRYFSLGNIQFTDDQGNNLQQFRPNELSADLFYARKLAKVFSLGVSLRFVYSNLAGGTSDQSGNVIKPAIAGAADISWLYNQNFKPAGSSMSHDVSVGMNISNIGNKVSYTNGLIKDFLPTNLGIGIGYKLNIDAKNQWGVYVDFNKLMVPSPSTVDADSNKIYDFRQKTLISGMFGSFNDAPGGAAEELKEVTVGIGTEYMYNRLFGVRAGYFYESKTKGGRQFATIGLTAKYSIAGLHFSYLFPTSSQRNPLDNTLRFSLVFEINKGGLKSQPKGFSLVDEPAAPAKEKKKKKENAVPAPVTPAPAEPAEPSVP